jgi:RimJ/RimL family protein N-acetyltransferase
MAEPLQLNLTDPGAMLSTTHELADGSRVRLRLTRPSDAPRVRGFLDGLSPTTRARRFGDEAASEADVRELTFYDPRSRLVAAATMPVAGGEQIVGLADVSLQPSGLAEIGVVIGDDAQGRGVGKLLSESVASLAFHRGATQLKAPRVDGNRAMAALLERLGPTVRTIEDGTTVAYTRLQARPRRAA